MKPIIPLLASVPLAVAWYPGVDKDIFAATGNNIFNSSSNAVGKRYLPDPKIRGVNLGAHFIFEPWIAENKWKSMGCPTAEKRKSEFDCGSSLGHDQTDKVFQDHWGSWITKEDISQMRDYGLITIRIPVGYWLKEDLVDANSEHFPRGGLQYLSDVCDWAAEAGMYIVMDFHGLPGAQQAKQPFTGQYAPSAGFYNDFQYGRALEWIEWMTKQIHQDNKFRNVGMIELVNEPLQGSGETDSMRKSYYPDAWKRIRDTESSLGVAQDNSLHIQMMNTKWGSGDPKEFLPDDTFAAYDDHRYLKWTKVPADKDSYIEASCNDDRGGDTPTIVGEWSLSVNSDVEGNDDWDPSTNQDFYSKWFAAQVIAYEKQQGWVFWTWKADLGDYRWSYKDAVDAGVIPKDLGSVYDNSPC